MANEKRLIDVTAIRKHAKPKADSTLRNMKKSELIEYIRMLEYNFNVSESFLDQQAKNFEMLMNERCEKCLMEQMGIRG